MDQRGRIVGGSYGAAAFGWIFGRFVPALGVAEATAAAVDVEEEYPTGEEDYDRSEDGWAVGDDGVDYGVVVGAAVELDGVKGGVELREVAGGVEAEGDHEGEKDDGTDGEDGASFLDDGVDFAGLEGALDGRLLRAPGGGVAEGRMVGHGVAPAGALGRSFWCSSE